MSTGTRVPLEDARYVAHRIAGDLAGACQRIEVAGSIRRGRPDVGDVELVAIPRFETRQDGMFGEVEVNLLTERIDDMLTSGTLRSHPTDPKRGERYSKVLEPLTGLQVDIFTARPETWGMVYLIRTGPAAYSHRFVTTLRRVALHAAEGELHRGSLGCGSYRCEVVPTVDEEDVYAAARWPFVAPEARA